MGAEQQGDGGCSYVQPIQLRRPVHTGPYSGVRHQGPQHLMRHGHLGPVLRVLRHTISGLKRSSETCVAAPYFAA